MIIISNTQGVVEIIDKIKYLNKKCKKESFFKKTKRIELLIKINNKILLNYSELKFLKDSFDDLEIVINLTGNIENSESIKNLEDLNIKYKILEEKYYIFSVMKFNFNDLRKSLEKNKKYVIILSIITILYCISMMYFYSYKIDTDTIKYINKNYIMSTSSENYLKLNSLVVFSEKQTGFGPNNIDFSGTNRAIGNIELKNNSLNKVSLIEKTRLKNENGIIFRTIDNITIPKANKDKDGKIIPGIKNTTVIADIFDEKKEFIGKKGNIKENTKLSLVSKNSFNLDIKTKNNFYGGEDNYSFYFTENDKTNIENIFNLEIKKKAIFEANEILKIKSEEKDRKFLMLTNPESYLFKDYNIIEKDIREKKMYLNGTIKAVTHYIDTTEVEKIMIGDIEHKSKKIIIERVEVLEKNPLKVNVFFELQYK